MKPNKKTKEFLNNVGKTISFIQNTNDLSSPTHHSDLELFVDSMVEEYDFNSFDKEHLKDALISILCLARKVQST